MIPTYLPTYVISCLPWSIAGTRYIYLQGRNDKAGYYRILRDPCKTGLLIPSNSRQPRTMANTYLSTYMFGKNIPKKSSSELPIEFSKLLHLMSSIQSTKWHPNDTLCTFYFGWEVLGVPSGSVWTRLSFQWEFWCHFIWFSDVKQCPNELTLVYSGTGRILSTAFLIS